MTVFRVIYVFLWCSIHFADCKHRTWLVTQILGIPFQLWIWHDSSQPKLWFLQTWMKIKFLGSEGGGCPPSKPLAIESSCLFLASNRGRPQEYHIMDSGALLTFTRTVSILVKQPPPVRKRMDEEKCSGPNCRSDAISRYRSIRMRFGTDGMASHRIHRLSWSINLQPVGSWGRENRWSRGEQLYRIKSGTIPCIFCWIFHVSICL